MRNLIIGLLCLVCIQSCIRNTEDCPKLFIIEGEIIPYLETYNIGDTITIHSKVDKHIFETKTQQKYDIGGLEIRPIISAYGIFEDNDMIGSAIRDYFDFVPNSEYMPHWYMYSDNTATLDCNYQYSSNNIHILSESPFSYFNTWLLIEPDSRFYNAGGFCFRVK